MKRTIPRLYEGIYAKAMKGRSMKAGIHSFCLECAGYMREEVKDCTDLGCPLYPYRPYRISKRASQGAGLAVECEKSEIMSNCT